MFGFTIVWVGQLVSVLSTNMSAFALTIWVFEKTGSATALGLMQVFFITPYLLITPFVGVMVDRHNRKLMMALSDMASGVSTIGVPVLYLSGRWQIWHLYVANAIMGVFQTFQWPAYSSAISLRIVSKSGELFAGPLSMTICATS